MARRETVIIDGKKMFVEQGHFWAYYSPDGNIQSRSIAPTKKLAREYVCYREWHDDGRHVDYTDYEKKGFTLEKIYFHAKPIL